MSIGQLRSGYNICVRRPGRAETDVLTRADRKEHAVLQHERRLVGLLDVDVAAHDDPASEAHVPAYLEALGFHQRRRAVREAQPLPVVAGQGEITRWGCRDLILHGRVNILNTDVTVAGGITEWRRVAALASGDSLASVREAIKTREQRRVDLAAASNISTGWPEGRAWTPRQ